MDEHVQPHFNVNSSSTKSYIVTAYLSRHFIQLLYKEEFKEICKKFSTYLIRMIIAQHRNGQMDRVEYQLASYITVHLGIIIKMLLEFVYNCQFTP